MNGCIIPIRNLYTNKISNNGCIIPVSSICLEICIPIRYPINLYNSSQQQKVAQACLNQHIFYLLYYICQGMIIIQSLLESTQPPILIAGAIHDPSTLRHGSPSTCRASIFNRHSASNCVADAQSVKGLYGFYPVPQI